MQLLHVELATELALLALHLELILPTIVSHALPMLPFHLETAIATLE
jgi:hypothetical protein